MICAAINRLWELDWMHVHKKWGIHLAPHGRHKSTPRENRQNLKSEKPRQDRRRCIRLRIVSKHVRGTGQILEHVRGTGQILEDSRICHYTFVGKRGTGQNRAKEIAGVSGFQFQNRKPEKSGDSAPGGRFYRFFK